MFFQQLPLLLVITEETFLHIIKLDLTSVKTSVII